MGEGGAGDETAFVAAAGDGRRGQVSGTIETEGTGNGAAPGLHSVLEQKRPQPKTRNKQCYEK